MATFEANELVSKPVISTSRGTEAGRVRDGVFKYTEHRLLGLVVEVKDGCRFLPMSGIQAVGRDAVTIVDEGVLTPIDAHDEAREIMSSGIHLRGTALITESGDKLGTLDKILMNKDGTVSSYVPSPGVLGLGGKRHIAPQHVRSIGSDAIVVAAAAGNVDSMPDGDEHEDTPAESGIMTSNDTRADFGIPPGTDPNKETVVSEPDSQPGNLMDEDGRRHSA